MTPASVQLVSITNPNSPNDGYSIPLSDLAEAVAAEWRRNPRVRLSIKRGPALTAKEWKEVERNGPEHEGW